MNVPRVVTHGGVTLNLATIKCFKLQTNFDLGKTNVMIVEHKNRFDYIQHPYTGEYEKKNIKKLQKLNMFLMNLLKLTEMNGKKYGKNI